MQLCVCHLTAKKKNNDTFIFSPTTAADVESRGPLAQLTSELLQGVSVHMRGGNGNAVPDALRRIHIRTHFAIIFSVCFFHRFKHIIALDDAVGTQVSNQRGV